VKKALLITLFVIAIGSLAAQAQDYAGVQQCYINGTWVTVKGNCPATGGGSSPGVNPNNGFYQLGNQLGNAIGELFFGWLRSPNSNPQAELQKQQMMEELRRREEEAARQHREEEARRLAAMYNRLAATLKLTGLPYLQLKPIASNGPGLKLKLGDSSQGYGIQGLPGMYVGGPGLGSGMKPQNESKLQLKTGDSADANHAGNPNLPGQALNDGEQAYGIPGLPGIYTGGPGPGSGMAPKGEPGLQMKTGDSSAAPAAQAATFDPSKMTPQQLADVAEQISKLPPEEQQRLMTAAQNNAGRPQQAPTLPAGSPASAPAAPVSAASAPGSSPVLSPQTAAQPVASVQQQANASQAAAAAPVLENASAKARSGFDTPLGATAASPTISNQTPSILRPPGTTIAANRVPAASSSAQAPPSRVSDDIKQFLFPGSQSTSPFPKDPNPPLANPLREEARLQAELKRWDDWAIQRAAHLNGRPHDSWMAQPQATELVLLNANAVKQYAPELLARYNSDTAFRQSVDLRLQYTNEHVALAYYQGLAEAHKAAILAFQAELEKLAAAGTLDKLVPLEDQYRLHPERRQIVQSVWDRVSANEQTALAKAQAEGSSKLDKEYQFAFQLIRGEAAQQR
jgi:hypothetical protein